MTYQLDKALRAFLTKGETKGEGVATITSVDKKIGKLKAVTLALTGGIELTVTAKELHDKPIKLGDQFFFSIKSGDMLRTVRPETEAKVKVSKSALDQRGEGSARLKSQRA